MKATGPPVWVLLTAPLAAAVVALVLKELFDAFKERRRGRVYSTGSAGVKLRTDKSLTRWGRIRTAVPEIRAEFFNNTREPIVVDKPRVEYRRLPRGKRQSPDDPGALPSLGGPGAPGDADGLTLVMPPATMISFRYNTESWVTTQRYLEGRLVWVRVNFGKEGRPICSDWKLARLPYAVPLRDEG